MARRNEDKVIRNNNKKAHSKIKTQNKKATGRVRTEPGKSGSASSPRTGSTRNAGASTRNSERSEGSSFKEPNRTLKYGLGGEHVEGFHAVEVLIEHGRRKVTRLYVDREIADSTEMTSLIYKAELKNTRVTRLSREQFMGRARTESPQGVIAYCTEKKPMELDDMLLNPKAFLVVLDSLTDPNNIGAIIRSAEVAGATGVILPKHRSGHLSPSAVKNAAGAVEFMNFGLCSGVPSFLMKAQKAGVTTLGMAGESKESLYDIKESAGPVIVIIGSEGKGLSQLVRKRCDHLLKIDQYGNTESLNASAAAAVTLMHLAHLRN